MYHQGWCHIQHHSSLTISSTSSFLITILASSWSLHKTNKQNKTNKQYKHTGMCDGTAGKFGITDNRWGLVASITNITINNFMTEFTEISRSGCNKLVHYYIITLKFEDIHVGISSGHECSLEGSKLFDFVWNILILLTKLIWMITRGIYTTGPPLDESILQCSICL